MTKLFEHFMIETAKENNLVQVNLSENVMSIDIWGCNASYVDCYGYDVETYCNSNGYSYTVTNNCSDNVEYGNAYYEYEITDNDGNKVKIYLEYTLTWNGDF